MNALARGEPASVLLLVGSEPRRTASKIYDRANSAYSIYARATALRRDNLRHSADELRAQLAKAKTELLAIS